jgi:hypothetical protein
MPTVVDVWACRGAKNASETNDNETIPARIADILCMLRFSFGLL